MLFLPWSLVFGWVARQNGVYESGFMLAGAAVLVGTLLILSVRAGRGVAPVEVAATAKEEAVEVAQAAEQLACKQLGAAGLAAGAARLPEPLRPSRRGRRGARRGRPLPVRTGAGRARGTGGGLTPGLTSPQRAVRRGSAASKSSPRLTRPASTRGTRARSAPLTSRRVGSSITPGQSPRAPRT